MRSSLIALQYIHRCFFAHALSTSADPMKSEYAPSFTAGYLSAKTMISSVKQQFLLFPKQICRFWVLWTHAFSSSVSRWNGMWHVPMPASLTDTPQSPPLYLRVTSTSKEGLEQAIAQIQELMNQELPDLVDQRRFRRREPEQFERDEFGRVRSFIQNNVQANKRSVNGPRRNFLSTWSLSTGSTSVRKWLAEAVTT